MKHLLPPVKKYFKACLHTHSTVSDGKLTPEEVRDAYRAEGYSVVALTDHSVTVSHQELNLPDFLMLTGVEIDVDDSDYALTGVREKVRHMCLISKDPNRLWIPFRDPEPIPCSLQYEALDEIGDFTREYSAENFNALIAECNRQGFLVTYNHPCWSLEGYADYITMEGLWAMEYRNTGSINLGYDENNGRVYQDFLMQGKRLVPVMADDMHRPEKNGVRELGVSWAMIGAEELTYDAVIAAMERGDLYSSCGPEISGIVWDEGKLHVSCTPGCRVQVVTQTRRAALAVAPEGQVTIDMSKWLTHSKGNGNAFLRLIVTAPDGSYAVSRAYWLDELD